MAANAGDWGVPKGAPGIHSPIIGCDPRLEMTMGGCPHPWFINGGAGLVVGGDQTNDFDFKVDLITRRSPNDIFNDYLNQKPWLAELPGRLTTEQLLALPGILMPPSPGVGWTCSYPSPNEYHCVRQTLGEPAQDGVFDTETRLKIAKMVADWKAVLGGDVPWPKASDKAISPNMAWTTDTLWSNKQWPTITTSQPQGRHWSCRFISADFYRCTRAAIDLPIDGAKFIWNWSKTVKKS